MVLASPLSHPRPMQHICTAEVYLTKVPYDYKFECARDQVGSYLLAAVAPKPDARSSLKTSLTPVAIRLCCAVSVLAR